MKRLKKVKINRRYVFYAVLFILYILRRVYSLMFYHEYPFQNWSEGKSAQYVDHVLHVGRYLYFVFVTFLGLCMADVEALRIKNFKVTWQSLVRAAVVAMVSWLGYTMLWRRPISDFIGIMPHAFVCWLIGVNIPAIFFRRGMEVDKTE